ncbi:MAG: hypothetical protein Fur003_1800 [Candidatus Dojkabacteria bacterium]
MDQTLQTKQVTYYQATPERPYHLSVGGVVYDFEKDRYLVMEREIPEGITLTYFPTETVEPKESLEASILRGLSEESGLHAEIITHIGAMIAKDVWFSEIDQPTEVSKTIIFFLLKPIKQDDTLRKADDEEKDAKVVYYNYEELLKIFNKQYETTGMNFFAFSEILQRAQDLIEKLKANPEKSLHEIQYR